MKIIEKIKPPKIVLKKQETVKNFARMVKIFIKII